MANQNNLTHQSQIQAQLRTWDMVNELQEQKALLIGQLDGSQWSDNPPDLFNEAVILLEVIQTEILLPPPWSDTNSSYIHEFTRRYPHRLYSMLQAVVNRAIESEKQLSVTKADGRRHYLQAKKMAEQIAKEHDVDEHDVDEHDVDEHDVDEQDVDEQDVDEIEVEGEVEATDLAEKYFDLIKTLRGTQITIKEHMKSAEAERDVLIQSHIEEKNELIQRQQKLTDWFSGLSTSFSDGLRSMSDYIMTEEEGKKIAQSTYEAVQKVMLAHVESQAAKIEQLQDKIREQYSEIMDDIFRNEAEGRLHQKKIAALKREHLNKLRAKDELIKKLQDEKDEPVHTPPRQVDLEEVREILPPQVRDLEFRAFLDSSMPDDPADNFPNLTADRIAVAPPTVNTSEGKLTDEVPISFRRSWLTNRSI